MIDFRRRKGAHARALQAVEASRKAGLAVFVSTVVTKQRLHSAEFIEFIKYFNDKDLGVFLTFAKPVGAWQGKYDMLVDPEDLQYVKQLETKHKIFSHLTPAYGLDLGCTAVKGMVCVTQYGDVLPCQYIFISLGNIFEEPLREIIQRGLNIKWFGEHVDVCPSRMIDTSSTSISPAESITSRSRFHIMKSLRKRTKHDRHSICRFGPANLRDADT